MEADEKDDDRLVAWRGCEEEGEEGSMIFQKLPCSLCDLLVFAFVVQYVHCRARRYMPRYPSGDVGSGMDLLHLHNVQVTLESRRLL